MGKVAPPSPHDAILGQCPVPKGLVRRSQAWCPLCYEEWKRDGAAIYNPLLWSLEVVSRCPLHHTPLHQRCPQGSCNRPIPLLAPGARPGYCSYCGRWLGCPHAENPISAATRLGHDDIEWQHWVASRVAELIASVPQLQGSLLKDHFAEAVAAYLDGVAGSNVSAASRLLQVSRRTSRDRKNGVQFERYRAEQCEEKKRLLIREVRQATLEVHSQGVYPSQLRVRNLLAKPGSIRIPEALATWHATLKGLGWEK
jgi:hypothetical protein